ncbi:transporter substrate-binding domain-containing protein [Oscillatoria sp. CS-180]|uniref:transporter substrate-binding domain-containing protein n=1 Tax=Oscillatoria sp. CS-180 TaxID=3021720 RepID=UPI00232E4F7B|nr:transporter substrate-binding domain-containing protein [Oscillatoria sp. CS-180]MDB9525656.1 transporter substrate-binding domain-containing protein [Oscillatoria sp. CS-180]
MRFSLLGCGVLLGMHLVASPVVVSADLETIQERGYLVVAVKDNWRPLGFIDEDGDLVGFEIDIASRLAETLFDDASAVQFYPVSNQDRIPAVLNDEADIAIAGISITAMRQRIVTFSTPYYLDGTAFVTPSPDIQDITDLRQETIALIEGSDAVTHVDYTLPLADLVGFPSYKAAYEAAEAGQVSAIAGDVTVLAGWVQEYPEYRLLPSILTAEPLAITLPKGNQYGELRRFINMTLEQWHEEGWLEERATYWGLP